MHARPERAAGAPATVDDHTEAGHPGADVLGDPVQPGLIPLSCSAGDRHVASLIGACAPERPAVMPGQAVSWGEQHPTPPLGAIATITKADRGIMALTKLMAGMTT
jgi:hypothetical protein